jgi:hypothetical protein
MGDYGNYYSLETWVKLIYRLCDTYRCAYILLGVDFSLMVKRHLKQKY